MPIAKGALSTHTHQKNAGADENKRWTERSISCTPGTLSMCVNHSMAFFIIDDLALE